MMSIVPLDVRFRSVQMEEDVVWVRMGIAVVVLGVITTRVGWMDLSEVSRERHESEAFMRL
jgi:hypothetical protein